METDDDVLVVIVGDEDEKPPDKRKQSFYIKEEPIEQGTDCQAVEDLIIAAETHGQVIKMENIKEEPQDYEYLDTECCDEDKDYEPNWDEINSDDDIRIAKDECDASDDELQVSKDKHRYKLLKPGEQKSFVDDLRQQYPELEEDRQLLIETLCEIMRSIKRPPPPQDFFIMNDIQFECVKCEHLTDTIPAAHRHWQEKHGQRYLVCFACGVDFRSTTNLYKHEKRCSAPDAVIVLKARALSLGKKGRGRPFLPRPEDIKLREKLDKDKKRFACTFCPADFSSKAALKSHQLAHRGARPYRCPDCPAAYTSKSGLARHWVKHTDIEFICDHCSRSFKSKTSLIAHLDTHKALRKFPCEVCGRRFAQRMAMQLHADRTHRNLPPPCACQICPKRYPRMSLLKNHMLKAHGMNLITRKMFYKSLPMLSDTQLKQARVVLKSETDALIQYPYNDIDNQWAQDIAQFEGQNAPDEFDENVIREHEYNTDTTAEEAAAGLSEEVIQYLKKLQQGQIDENTKFVVIENGEITCVDESNIDSYRTHLSEVEAAFESEEMPIENGKHKIEIEIENVGIVENIGSIKNEIESVENEIENDEAEMKTQEIERIETSETQSECGIGEVEVHIERLIEEIGTDSGTEVPVKAKAIKYSDSPRESARIKIRRQQRGK